MSESGVTIRPANKEDMVAVADMIQELANFEEMPDGPKIGAKVLQRDGFESSPAAFRCVVAERAPSGGPSAVVGYALFFPTYSTWRGRSVLLEDLYVKPEERRRGVGARLFNAVAKEAVSSGCSRVDFHVLEWNPARAFYAARGARDLTGSERWRLYRLEGDALASAADG